LGVAGNSWPAAAQVSPLLQTALDDAASVSTPIRGTDSGAPFNTTPVDDFISGKAGWCTYRLRLNRLVRNLERARLRLQSRFGVPPLKIFSCARIPLPGTGKLLYFFPWFVHHSPIDCRKRKGGSAICAPIPSLLPFALLRAF
jgi:hypothetical protein